MHVLLLAQLGSYHSFPASTHSAREHAPVAVAAIVVARHSLFPAVGGIAKVCEAVVVDVVAEAVAASSGRAPVVESVSLARPALGVVEEARGFAVGELERMMRSQRHVQTAAIRPVGEALAGELAAQAHCGAVVLIVLGALWQRHPVGQRGSRTRLISALV